MSNGSDDSLDILIRLLAETRGADIVQAALDKTKEATSDAASSTEKLTEVTDEGAKSAEKFHTSARGLESILRVIATEAGPQAGLALGSLAFAGTGSMLLASLAVRELFEGLNKLKQEADAAAKSMSAVGIAARDSAEDAAQAWDDYIAKLNAAKDPAEKLKGIYSRQKSALDDIAAAHEKILQDMEQEELAAAKGDRAKENEIKARYNQTRMDYETASGQVQIELHQRYIAELQSRQPGLNVAADLAARDLAYQKSIQVTSPGFKIDEDLENKLTTALREATEKAQRAESGTETPLERVEGYSLQDRREQLAEAQKAFDDYQKNRTALLSRQAAIQRDTDLLKTNEEARDRNKDAIQKETDALNQERDKASSQVAGDAVSKAIDLSRRAGAGGSLNPSESQFVQMVAGFASGQRLNLATAEAMFQNAADKPTAIDNFLNRIVALLEKIPDPSRLEYRLSELESRFNTIQSSMPRVSTTGQ